MKLAHRISVLLICLMWATTPALAKTLLTEKQVFTLPKFTTFGGRTIKNVKVGWESYGTLNKAKDNVILITHYFTGSSHAAGKYDENDDTPGYWDAIIGPDKAIDTNKYFVISADTLANINAYDRHVVTTGPASINPDTNKPYGLSFPVVTIRDFVNVQKALITSLGITKLHAVVGPSMGSMQAIDWASTYPNWVPKVISVIGAGETDAWTAAALEHWSTPIRLDRHWNNGSYYDGEHPRDGLVAAIMLITQHALYPTFFNQQGAKINARALETGPLNDINDSHSIVKWLKQRAAQRAQHMDANHLLYLVRACQLFVAGHQTSLQEGLSRVKADVLFLPANTDLLLMPYLAHDAHTKLEGMGKKSQLDSFDGDFGHLEGIADISEHGEAIRTFLNQ